MRRVQRVVTYRSWENPFEILEMDAQRCLDFEIVCWGGIMDMLAVEILLSFWKTRSMDKYIQKSQQPGRQNKYQLGNTSRNLIKRAGTPISLISVLGSDSSP